MAHDRVKHTDFKCTVMNSSPEVALRWCPAPNVADSPPRINSGFFKKPTCTATQAKLARFSGAKGCIILTFGPGLVNVISANWQL